MKNHLLLAIAILFSILGYTQNKAFEITGTLISKEDKTVLEAATVYVERLKDSTLVTYTITDKKGVFKLENKTYDKQLKLLISFVGYKTYSKIIKINQPKINLDTIHMKVGNNILDEVVIKSRAPITIKKDTLEFNVKFFKTKKDANVEDLLKVLPGVEVDLDGKITINGKPVNKILVNGKPFFGNDPVIATRNLAKAIIETVQVVDTKTDAQAFTGEVADGKNKTINLTVKKENNKGVFGNTSIGLGTDERYEYKGMLNRFNNDQRISIILGGNNHNSIGFSSGISNFSMVGGPSNLGSGSLPGITTSSNVGVNFVDEITKTFDLATDYFYANSSTENKTTTQRENILPNSRFFTNSESFSLNDSYSNKANMGFDFKIDATLLINIKPSFKFTNSENLFSSAETSSDELNKLINQSTTQSTRKNLSKNFNNDIDITKKFGSKGAYLSVSIENDISASESDSFLESEINIYGDNPNNIVRDQFTDGDNEVNNFRTNFKYNLPLIAKELMLNLGYSYSNDTRHDIQSTLDKDINGNYTVFNTDLSTDFKYIDEILKPEVSINYRSKKGSTNFGISYLSRTLENQDLLRPQFNIARKFKAVELNTGFRLNFSSKSAMNMSYHLTNRPPQLSQLQAFQDVSNPLNIRVGNPNLEPRSDHTISANFYTHNFQKGTGFNFRLITSFMNNQVVSNTIINEDLVSKTTYTNVNGNYMSSGGASYSKRVKIDSLRSVNIGVSLNGSLNKTINFNNGIKYASRNTSIRPGVNLTFSWKDVMYVRPSYTVSFSRNSFDIDSFDDREFLSHNLNLNLTTSLPKKFDWRNDIRYNYNPNVAANFQKSSWFWNSTLSYAILKDKATLSLKAYDILKQNTNARRTANQNFIQDSQSTVLQQYFMIGFSWKFNNTGKRMGFGRVMRMR
ncbi:outer membrane beta-barrel protein [uncultured Polaribacter sp.]|uniref:outer membrane beta-barrel protein n=1 Tax=uncultured Polaribacter sp. TaxID=174711 RepID=UPI002610F328|nr:outer membrane beta-barrel protein [uncultured Polaribacter sp.]